MVFRLLCFRCGEAKLSVVARRGVTFHRTLGLSARTFMLEYCTGIYVQHVSRLSLRTYLLLRLGWVDADPHTSAWRRFYLLS